MVSIHPQIDEQISTLVSSGNLWSSHGRLALDLDDQALHDAVLISFCFAAGMRDAALLSITGIFPDLQHVFRLDFYDYKRFFAEGVVIGRQIGIREASIAKIDNDYTMCFLGEFDTQKISLACRKAEYKKYKLEQPMTRLEMGWL